MLTTRMITPLSQVSAPICEGALSIHPLYNQTRIQKLEARVAELEKDNLRLETGSQLTREIISILDLDELLKQATKLIHSQFSYYFVGIWLVSEKGDSIVLQAGTGQEDEQLPQPGLRILMSTSSPLIDVCRTGKGQSIDDLSTSFDFSRLTLSPEIRSELIVPLRVGDRVIGLLDVLEDQVAAFTEEDLTAMKMLAAQIVIAIGNAQRYAAEQGRRQLAESLEQSGRELSSSLDLNEMASQVLQIMGSVVSYESGSVLLRHNETLRLVAQAGSPKAEPPTTLKIPITPGDVFEQLATSKRPLIVDDVTHEPGWWQEAWLPKHFSWMGVPLINEGKILGLISLTRSTMAAFAPEDAILASAFAGQAAIALQNASLYGELDNAYHTLERLDQTKSDFITVVAHELRTPLTVVKTYMQMLQDLPTVMNDDTLKSYVEGVLSGEERMHRIVNSMLDIIKIENQTMGVRLNASDLSNIVTRIRSEFSSALEERHLTLTLDNLDTLPETQLDAQLIHKTLRHIIVNAIKYTPDGGSISVSGQVIDDTNDKYDAQLGPCVEICVSDTGIGIDPEQHELIFEKFYQTGKVAMHSSGFTKFKGGGSGLGLAIAKGIVLAHNGKIWVESQAHDEDHCPGSQFYVRLPLTGLQT